MVKPFRELEDALMMGPLVGGMERQMELFLNLIREQDIDFTDELKKDLGELQSIIHTLRIVAYEAASMLDSPNHHPEFLSILISFRNLSRQFQNLFELLINKAGIEKYTDLYRITNDMAHGIDMAKNVALIKQKKIGEKLLQGKEYDEFTP